MQTVKLLFFSQEDSFQKYKQFTRYVSPARREKISRFVYDKDKLLSLFAALLVRQDIMHFTGIQNHELLFSVNQYGKPFSASAKFGCEFSVSHTNGCVSYIRSDCPCGIDAEAQRNVKLSFAEHFFCADERVYIKNSKQPENALIEIWTKKEAYLKMQGTGLSTPLGAFNVLRADIADKMVTLNERSIYISFCSEDGKNGETKISFIKPMDICAYFRRCCL